MAPRLAPVIAVTIALLAVAACASTAPTATPPTSSPEPTSTPGPSATPVEPVATASPDSGNVDGRRYPELTVEALGPDAVRVTIADPAARAWRLVIAGTGAGAGDRLDLVVETGDTGPSIIAAEVRGGAVVDEMDLSGYADGTAAAGGCHRTLAVCVDSDGFRLPADDDGTFSVRLAVVDSGPPLTITGGTATWPAEPFILGSWTDTEPFAWSVR
jgi:hypothetical protein